MKIYIQIRSDRIITSKICLYKSWNFFMMRFLSATADSCSFNRRSLRLRTSSTSSANDKIWSNLRFRQFCAATLFLPRRRMSRISDSWVSLRSYLDNRSLNSSIGKLMISTTAIGTCAIKIPKSKTFKLNRCTQNKWHVYNFSLTFNARARFSSRLRCSSSVFLEFFLSRGCDRGVAPLACGNVYVWLCPTISWMPRGLWRPKSIEHCGCDWCFMIGIPPAAPSRFVVNGWCIG